MKVPALLRALFPSIAKAVEGEYRPGPYWLPITGGWLSPTVGQNWNWWQMGYNPSGIGTSAIVEACVSAYAQTVAMCPGDHWRTREDGGRDRVTTSAISRILRRPNSYQSISDFLLNATRSLYCEGNAYALALRNDRFEIDELHLMHPRQSRAIVAETGDVFYTLAGNEIVDRMVEGAGVSSGLLNAVPARDVLHIRLHTPQHPLRGESPLMAAALDIAAQNAAIQQQLSFYLNQARPSYILGTDQILNAEQVSNLRLLWDEASKGLNAGKTPILSAGLKPLPITVSPQDAQLKDLLKLSDEHVALVYRVPLQILGLGGTPFASSEVMMQSWLASALGFALNHIEEAFGLLFGLKGQPDEYLELNTEALLRSAFKERVDGYTAGVIGGIFAPNEARASFGLKAAKAGDEPRVQQQVVPLSFATEPPVPPAPPAAPIAPPTDDEPQPEKVSAHDIRKSFRASFDRSVAV
jgi:HK97 family phage portal protein